METVLQRRNNKSTSDNSEGVTIAAVLLACLVSSIVGQAGMGATPAFRVPNYRLQSIYEMPLVLMLGTLGGGVSSAMVYASQVRLLRKTPSGLCSGYHDCMRQLLELGRLHSACIRYCAQPGLTCCGPSSTGRNCCTWYLDLRLVSITSQLCSLSLYATSAVPRS